jgi:hypothetical protein
VAWHSRTIGGLDFDVTLKGLGYHGEWLQIEFRGAESAYVRRRHLVTYYAVPLSGGAMAVLAQGMTRGINQPGTAAAKLGKTLGLRKTLKRLKRWPKDATQVWGGSPCRKQVTGLLGLSPPK